ncbi:MAG TPA: hypothetical protein VGJ87_14260 [Roseiflexaceae bacterium]|jgi:hypothetical protein
MTYHITYHADDWVRVKSGAPELRQVRTADLGDGTQLVAVLVCGIDGRPLRVAEAWIEQAYVTRTEGWKRRTLRRVHPREIQLSEPDAPPSP